ncbi:hypothetical protein GE061_004370 [Apolygus lucorum]|uniref:Lipase n=1 Tax=Apolygus lucorum TaxID=248454 RepID=A0A8S9X0H7_APOLU|nr:hypothetical protein GE061_004370 [Apolygus lucorum]
MSGFVRSVVLTAFCLRFAIGFNMMETLFKWGSTSWGETPVTTTRDIARRYGFQSEMHQLITDDGYVIRMTRIHGMDNVVQQPKLPILLMHGLLSSSDHWLVGGRGKDLPLLLAELGHDVWLGDWRGNTFSRGHRELTTSDPSYWNFTYHSRAHHDLPAFIDRVLEVSQVPQLIYIGYSYGTTAVMVLGSELPEYQNKIKQAILLAPVGYQMRDMFPTIRSLVNWITSTHKTTATESLFELLPRESVLTPLWRPACNTFQDTCLTLLFNLFGQRKENMDEEMFDNLLHRLPSGSSSLDVIYLAQIFSKGFRAYDFGKRTNEYVYGQKSPPLVPVETNAIPMAIYYSPSDHLNSELGVFELSRRLGNVTFVKKIGIANFSHLDYMTGKNVKRYLYDDIINLIMNLS